MFRISLIVLFLLAFLQLLFNQQIPLVVGYYYLLINLITLTVYAVDKSSAIKNRWRVKELHLHILAFIGGWWGALIAQQFTRHKSVKKSFLFMFSLTLLANILLLVLAVYKVG